MTNPHALGRYKYACESQEKAEQMVICLRMIAPECGFHYGVYTRTNIMKHGIICRGPPDICGTGFMLIDYERMKIDPEFILNLNLHRDKIKFAHLRVPIFTAT